MAEKKVVFTFGRFNPPTTGHYLLASKVKKEATKRKAEHRIYASSTQDAKKNPLSSKEKLRFMKKVLKGFNVIVDKSIYSPFAVLEQLSNEGYTDVTMVVGSDRVNEFKKQMRKYIGPNKQYKFKKFDVISAGERDPDAEGVSGMSASKMRHAAKEGNLDAFQMGVPPHVSSKDAEALFGKVQRGMGIKPFVIEGWFDINEFTEFLEEQNIKDFDMSGEGIDVPAIDNEVWGTDGLKKKKKKFKVKEEELNEISMQARRNMARSAKRTAKKRARKRKMKEKRKKSTGDIKNKAQKTALNTMRNKFLKGSKWGDMSHSDRERIEKKLKKKKAIITKMAKRLLPAMNRSEQERLKAVRTKMTSNDPKEIIDSIDIDFTNTVLVEYSRREIGDAKRIAAQREMANKEKEPQKADSGGDENLKQDNKERQAAIAHNEVEKRGSNEGQPTKDDPSSNDPFASTIVVRDNSNNTIKLMLHSEFNADRHKILVKQGKVNQARAMTASKEENFEWTATSTNLLGRSASAEQQQAQAQADGAVADTRAKEQKIDATDREVEGAEQEQQMQMDTEQQQAETEEDRQKEIKTQKKKANLKKERGQLFNSSDHASVDLEAGMVFVVNELSGFEGEGEISDKDMSKITDSLTLYDSSRRAGDSLINQLNPDGTAEIKATHYGKASEDISSEWKSFGAGNNTPKTDLYIERTINGKTEVLACSVKAGAGQLMSGGKEEARATLGVVLQRLKGCSNGDKNCKSRIDKNTVKRIEKTMATIDTFFNKAQTGVGVGPTSWHLKGGKYNGSKPKWWDTTGPGRDGTDWKDVVGTEPNPKHFKNFPEEGLKILREADEAHKKITEEVALLMSDSKEFKREIIFESMTGCGKFCGCCDRGKCSCSKAVATHMLTLNKDGTSAGIVEITDEYIDKIENEIKVKIRLKSSQESTKTNKEQYGMEKAGKYSWWSAFSLLANKFVTENFFFDSEELLESEQPTNIREYMMDAKRWIGEDPVKMLQFLQVEVDGVDTNFENLAQFNDEEVSGHTEITIDGITKSIPIHKDVDYYDGEEDSIDESFNHYKRSRDNNQHIYEFNDSSKHGIGSFASTHIEENDRVALYYLNLLNESAPEYQRTDFCRLTNHSSLHPNLSLVEEQDGNFYVYALRDIQENEELFINYFDVFEKILPALDEEGQVIPEVLRWTAGYEDLEFGEDTFGDLRDELQHFSEINEEVDIVTGVELEENLKRTIKNKIDAFKHYNSSSQKELRRKERERKKKEKKYNRMVGIHSEVQFDKDTELEEDAAGASATASETDAKRAAYLKQYGAKPEQRERRSARTNARNKAIRDGRASVGDGKDLDHKDGNPLNNSSKNLRMVSQNFNRGRDNNKWRKTNEEHGAGEIGTDKLLKRYIKDTPFMKIIKDKNGK